MLARQDEQATGRTTSVGRGLFSIVQSNVFTRWCFWGYLLLITIAEVLSSAVDPRSGLIVHAAILLALLVHGGIGRSEVERKLALGLTLAPLIRLLSFSLPLTRFPQAAWYPIVSAPLLLAVWLVIRQLHLPRRELGLRTGNVWLQILLIPGGVWLGALEYVILRPAPLLISFSWTSFWLLSLSLIVFTGFTEELIFRGLLQTLAAPMIGRGALVFVALLFAVLHTGYLSVADVLFVFAVGLLFAYLVRWGGSILGVTLAHGITNIMLFVAMPALVRESATIGVVSTSLILTGFALPAGVAALLLWWRFPREERRHAGEQIGDARPADAGIEGAW